MPYRIAGMDVIRRCWPWWWLTSKSKTNTSFDDAGRNEPGAIALLPNGSIEQQVEEVVMESTAQYWKPVWGALEQYWKPRCRAAGSCGPDVGHPPSRTSLVQSWRGGGERETFAMPNVC